MRLAPKETPANKPKQSFRDWFVIVRIFKVHWKCKANSQRFRHYYALGVPPLIALRWEEELKEALKSSAPRGRVTRPNKNFH